MENERINGANLSEQTRDGADFDWATDDFSSNVSHLIRTPLNGVIGMTELLLETELSSRQRMYAETALQSGERLLRVVEDILDYSKLQIGTMRLETTDFELRTLLRATTAPFISLADDEGLFLHYSVGHDVPDALRGDAGRIGQVVANLLRSAVAHTGDGGEVYLRVVLIEDSDEAVTVRFEVIDTAPGVLPERREEIFAGPTVPKGGSLTTGMELAISRRLARLMGGEMGVESDPVDGNVFFMELRLHKQSERPVFAPAPRFDLRSLRALIVGGDLTSREVLCEQAASWEMDADLADDASEAMELLRVAAQERPYDLVILDTDLWDADALDLARSVEEGPATTGTPVVLLTALSQDELGGASGAATVLTKPLSRQRLYEVLTEVTSSRPGAPIQPSAEETPVTQGTVGRPQGHVLVVEDDPVNQIVATRMLETIGYSFDVANDGCEALDAFEGGSYAAILMDVQMPRMDGYEAAAEIRSREGSAAPPPIIAMTANAMQGDRERALEAGMDDYLPKPVKRADLESTLARWTARAAETRSDAQAPEPESNPEDPLDHKALESLRELQVEGDPDILDELVGAFLTDTPSRLADLREQVSRGDAPAVGRTVHALKGSCATMGARHMIPLCEDLEEISRAVDLASAPERISTLEEEFERVRPALQTQFSNPTR